MNTVVKIRLLLLALTLCFIGTAVTINLTFNDKEILLLDGRQVQNNLHKKEQIVFSFLNDTSRFNALETVGTDVNQAEELLDYFVEQHDIYPFIYVNSELIIWGTDNVVPETDAGVPEGVDIINKTGNGWYETIKKSSGNLSAVFLIPIRSDYQKNNEYLQDRFSKNLIETNNLEIADYDDHSIHNIRSTTGEYLFSVKLREGRHDTFFSKLELAMWILAGLSVILLLNTMCIWLSKRGWVWSSVVLFAGCLAGIRYLDLHYGWLSSHFYTGLFDSRNFASSFLFPHLGGLLLNTIAFTWFIGYLYSFRKRLRLPTIARTKVGSVLMIFVLGAVLYGVSHAMTDVFSGLVTNSDINFDVTNILGLSFYSWIGIFALCLSMMSLLLLVDLLVEVAHTIIPDPKRLLLVGGAVVMIAAIYIYLDDFSFSKPPVTFLLLSALIGLRAWYTQRQSQFNLAVFISTLLLLASITAIKHGQFQRYKNEEKQKITISRLEAVDDANAIALFRDLEKEIVKDPTLIDYFRRPRTGNRELLNEHLKRTYLSGYLSRYEFTANEYDTNWVPIGNSSARKRQAYREEVISGAIKVSENFYRGNSRFGNFEYFAQLPVREDGELLGILLIELQNRSFSQLSAYPDILTDSRIDQQQTELMAGYAYAFYQHGNLVSQYGDYVYPLSDDAYPTEQRKFISLGTEGGYEHMMRRPNRHTLIVISSPQRNSWMQLAGLSFIFLVFLLFAALAFIVRWLVLTLNSNDFSLRNLRWSFLILSNRILYSTRIQSFMVVAVVTTLIVAGIITFFSVSSQFKKQQESGALQYAVDIASRLESRWLKELDLDRELSADEQFNTIAESIAADLNLYDTDGQLIYSTQPRIYDLRLLSRYMQPRAWLHMSRYQRSEFLHHEHIGGLNFIAAYAPIRNDNYEAVAFLSLPHYGYRKAFDQNVGLLLNTLINIYALVILVLGLFAVFVANKITAPLALVQRSLAKTSIGQPNEPIFWKRHDEIGSLIKEYNLMIVALEQSANTIMRSERESAWREMAKQVAHEIKNPLTPLKLGIQPLERSWKEKDPRFEERFEKFSDSFIEQIDSLSHIASEFSEFAKMPDTQLKEVDVIDILVKVAEVFRNNEGVKITVTNTYGKDVAIIQGDRDQLLRSFNNLIKNSIEAAISKRRCQINITISYDADHHVAIAIQDNGEGIAPEAREKLFQPNFTTKSSGTGLGLAFVQQAVEGMGGSIRYETFAGKGTTFYLRIPSIDAQ